MPTLPEPRLPGFDEPDASVTDSRTRPADHLMYVLGAVRRRRVVALSVFLGGLAALVLYYALATPVYRVEARLLAQRYQAPAMGRPTGSEDAPTRSAWELIHRRENLIALIKQTNLLAEAGPPSGPGVLQRLWRSILRGPAQSDDDPMEGLVLRLDKQLLVTTSGGTVDIEVDWPDAQQAYRLVEAAIQNFLEARHLQEITAIDETISLIQGRVATLRKQLDDVIAEVSQQERRQVRTALATPGGRVAEALPPQASQELVRLKSMLDAKERAIGDVEEFRRRRLADLQAQLDAQRAIYSDAHPNIITLRRDIDALNRDSPQIGALREDERRLRQEYLARAAAENVRPVPAVSSSPGAAPPVIVPRGGAVDENERVREARYRYQQMVERMNQAELELDASRAAFKYRYDVIWPAQVPKQPVSPNPLKVFGVGGLALLLLTLAVVTWLDWRSGLVLERWQVERELDVPVLADLSRG